MMSKEAKNTRPEYRCAAVIEGRRCNEPLSGHLGYISHPWVEPPEYEDARISTNQEDSQEA